MQIIKMILCICGILIVGFFFHRKKKDNQILSVENTNKVEYKSVSKDQDDADGQSQFIDDSNKESSIATPITKIFSSSETLELFSKDIINIENILDKEKAADLFLKSGWNTSENYTDSVQKIITHYRLPLDRSDVKTRVLALHFLSHSNYLEIDDCASIIENLESQFVSSQEKKIKYALMWDILEIGKICGAMDKISIKELTEQKIKNKTVQAQLNLALNIIKNTR